MAGFIRYRLPVDRRGRRAERVYGREPDRWNPPPTDEPIVIPPPTTHVGFWKANESASRFAATVSAVATGSMACGLAGSTDAESMWIAAAFLAFVYASAGGYFVWRYAEYRRFAQVASDPDEVCCGQPDTAIDGEW